MIAARQADLFDMPPARDSAPTSASRKQAALDAPPAARPTDTSQAAADSLSRAAPRLRRLVLQAIRDAGAAGLTADEVAARLKLSPLTARPRVAELNKAGQIRDSRVRRENRSGRTAIVWVAKEETTRCP